MRGRRWGGERKVAVERGGSVQPSDERVPNTRVGRRPLRSDDIATACARARDQARRHQGRSRPIAYLALAKELPNVLVGEATDGDGLCLEESGLSRVAVDAVDLAGAGNAEFERVAAARGERETNVVGADGQKRRVDGRVLPGLSVQKGGRECRRALDLGLDDGRRARRAAAADPNVVWRAQVRHVGDRALRVVLPLARKHVIEVLAAFGAHVDVIRVERCAPEKAAQPRHLAKRQVRLGPDVKVGDAQDASLRRQVARGAVHGGVERRDHCVVAEEEEKRASGQTFADSLPREGETQKQQERSCENARRQGQKQRGNCPPVRSPAVFFARLLSLRPATHSRESTKR